METQQALLRHTIDLNTELIAQAERLISASRPAREEAADVSSNDQRPRPLATGN